MPGPGLRPPMIVDPLFFAAALPAVLLLGLAKGGFYGVGLLSLPIVSLVVPPLQAAAILLPILIVQDAVTVWLFRAHWSRRVLGVMLPGALGGVLLGWLLAARVSDAAISFLLGAICIGFAARQLWLERAGPPEPRPGGLLAGIVCGAASGFASMIAQAGGPPYQIWVMPQRLPRDVLVGTSAIFFAILNWTKVVPFIALGQLDAAALLTSAALMPVAIGASFAGVALVRRVPVARLYPLINGLLLLVGLQLTLDGGRRLGLFG